MSIPEIRRADGDRTTSTPDDQRRRAQLVVAGNCATADDLRLMLDILGLSGVSA